MLALAKKMLVRNTEAQDAVRDTFVLIWKHAESCDTATTPARAWMYSILRHRARSSLNKPGRIAPAVTSWIDYLPARNVASEKTTLFYTAVQHMEPSLRRPLLMAYYHGYNDRQIATLLGHRTEDIQRQTRQGLRQISDLNRK